LIKVWQCGILSMDYAEVAWSNNIWKYDKLRQRMRILSNNFTRG